MPTITTTEACSPVGWAGPRSTAASHFQPRVAQSGRHARTLSILWFLFTALRHESLGCPQSIACSNDISQKWPTCFQRGSKEKGSSSCGESGGCPGGREGDSRKAGFGDPQHSKKVSREEKGELGPSAFSCRTANPWRRPLEWGHLGWHDSAPLSPPHMVGPTSD